MQNTSQIMAVIALIIALIAVVLAWMAFNRTGVNVETAIQRQVDEAVLEINTNFEQMELRLREEAAARMRETAEEVETDNNTNNVGE